MSVSSVAALLDAAVLAGTSATFSTFRAIGSEIDPETLAIARNYEKLFILIPMVPKSLTKFILCRFEREVSNIDIHQLLQHFFIP